SSPLPAAEVGQVFVSVADRDKEEVVPIARALAEMGYRLVSTRGTARRLRAEGIEVTEGPRIQEGGPNLLDFLKNKQVSLVINTPSGRGGRRDESKIRSEAVASGVTCITTLSAAEAAVEACRAVQGRNWGVRPLQEWFKQTGG